MLEKTDGRVMSSMKRVFAASGLVWIWITFIVVALDRYSKYWVENNIMPHEPLVIFPFFDLTLAYNTGAAFSFLHSASGWQNLMFVGLAFAVSAFIFVWLCKMPSSARWMNIALCLVLGGALGNAWDRLIYGYVIDFFHFHLNDWHFAIFNVADSAICVGAIMLILRWKQLPK